MAPRSSSRGSLASNGRAAGGGGTPPDGGRPGIMWTDSSTDHLGTHGANPARSAAPSGHPARVVTPKRRAPGGNDDLGDDSVPPGDVGGAFDAECVGASGGAVGSLSRSSMVAMKVRSSGPRDGRGPAMSASMSGRANAKPSPSISSPSSSSAMEESGGGRREGRPGGEGDVPKPVTGRVASFRFQMRRAGAVDASGDARRRRGRGDESTHGGRCRCFDRAASPPPCPTTCAGRGFRV